jgi:hypothetical protein
MKAAVKKWIVAFMDILHVIDYAFELRHLHVAFIVAAARCRPVQMVADGLQPVCDHERVTLICRSFQLLRQPFKE